MTYRPLFSRGQEDPRFDGPQPGLPSYMHESVRRWIDPFLRYRTRPPGAAWVYRLQLMRDLEIALHLGMALNWSRRDGSRAFLDVMDRVATDEEFALSTLDYLVGLQSTPEDVANELNDLLTRGGSEWEVVASPDGGDAGIRQLAKRSLGPVREAIEETRTESQRAHHHLMTAWANIAGRDPDPSTAYREAVRAVEAVAKPVILPDDSGATLGKMIAAIRDKPEKWEVVLENATPQDVAELAHMIWSSQLDRHGTDDEEVPLTVSQEQADAAVHLAIGLVRLFAGGQIRRVE